MAIIKTWTVEHEGQTWKHSVELLSDEAQEMAHILGIDIDNIKLCHLHDVRVAIEEVLFELDITEKCRRCKGVGRVTLYTRGAENVCFGCGGHQKKAHVNKRSLKKLQKLIDGMDDYEALNALVADKLKRLLYYKHKGIKKAVAQ